MIDLKHYERILESGLIFDHYIILCMKNKGEVLPNSRRVQGFVNLLNKKGFIKDDMLTEKALLLISEDIIINNNVNTTEPEKSNETDFTKWVIDLHKKCQNKLMELIGAKQIRGKIGGKPYPFLSNSTDLAKSLHRVIVLYKLVDMDKIERAMMLHIEKCHSSNNWFPLMKYYIIKSGVGGSVSSTSSDMVTDMESLDDIELKSGKSNQKFV